MRRIHTHTLSVAYRFRAPSSMLGVGQMRVAQVTLIQAAVRLRVPWHTAHRWVLTGELDGEQKNGRWFVRADSVESKAARLGASRNRPSQG